MLTTMRWAYEIRPATALGLPRRTTSHDRRELDLALRLIDTLAGEWDPRRYKDTYHDVLMPAKVRSLLSALEASLPERRPGARAAGRRQHRRAA